MSGLNMIHPDVFYDLIGELKKSGRSKHVIEIQTPMPDLILLCEDGRLFANFGDYRVPVKRSVLVRDQREVLEARLLRNFMADWRRCGKGASYAILG